MPILQRLGAAPQTPWRRMDKNKEKDEMLDIGVIGRLKFATAFMAMSLLLVPAAEAQEQPVWHYGLSLVDDLKYPPASKSSTM